MKTTVTLLALLILLSSCYTYRHIENDTSKLEINKKYHIITKNKKYKSIKIRQLNDSILVYTSNTSKKEKLIKLSDIKSIKKGKISVGKTITFSAVSAKVLILFIAILTWDGPSVNTGEITYTK